MTETANTLENIAASRGMKQRDCRDCTHFQPDEPELAYGWCKAHDQFVKLYHPAGEFWSQCQFKALSKERPT
ncbi:MAG: hypothetical protein M3Z84_03010 [Actinomycetota bacterium]|nr:hypothetical protein [Actinomycetota bacterium]